MKCCVVFQKWMSDCLNSSLFHSAGSFEFLLRDPEAFPGCSQTSSHPFSKLWVSPEKTTSRPPMKVTLLQACSTHHQNTSQRTTVLSLQETLPTSPRETPGTVFLASIFTKLAPSPNTSNWNTYKLLGKQQLDSFLVSLRSKIHRRHFCIFLAVRRNKHVLFMKQLSLLCCVGVSWNEEYHPPSWPC